MTSMEEKALIDAFCRRTQKEALSIQLDLSRKPTLTDSKFGGLPYWDLQKAYPQSSDGHKLALLAQFNLDELNRAGKNVGGQLPKSGMLQFFLDALNDDYVYGMEMTDYDPEKGVDFRRGADGKLLQDGFRVVYHPHIDLTVTVEAVKAIGMPDVSDDGTEHYAPLDAEYAVTLEPKICYMTPWDIQFDRTILQAAKEAGVPLKEEKGMFFQLSGALRNRLDQLYGSDGDCYGHWMLGYPSFTQDDPRTYQKRLEIYDVQLFQMDSEYWKDGGAKILWGDMGVANFLIPRENLKNCDFSDILYSWDCY